MLTNVFGIGSLGIAIGQLVSAYNYYLQLIGNKGEAIVQYEFRHVFQEEFLPETGDYVIVSQEEQPGGGFLYEYIQIVPTLTAEGLGVLSPTDSITLTGHSLGGHLAAGLSRLIPGVVEDVYTYNAPGFDFSEGAQLSDELIALFPNSSPSFNSGIIHSLVGEEGIDVVPSIGTSPSAQQDVYIEENAHSIVDLTDSLVLQSVLGKIDTMLTPNAALALLDLASNRVDNSLETTLDSLGKLFLGKDFNTPEFSGKNDVNARNEYHKNVQELLAALDARFPKDSSPLTLISLDGIGASELAARAGEGRLDILYALVELNPFVIGSADTLALQTLYQPFVDSGLLDLNQYSDDYLLDRARFLETLVDYNGEDWSYSNRTSDGTFYQDLERNFSIGAASSLFEGQTIQNPKVVFGSRGNDTITGSEPFSGLFGGDHLYGGFGNDNISGLGGNDHLEGNAGNDVLDGGAGNDDLFGGDGHDTLSGGVGEDNLYGGSGSDILNGGNENDVLYANDHENPSTDDHEQDRLIGGEGQDTFHINSGDVIDDNDGTIFLNGRQLTFNGTQVAEGSEYYFDEATSTIVKMVEGGPILDPVLGLPIGFQEGGLEYIGANEHFEVTGTDGQSGVFGFTLDDYTPVAAPSGAVLTGTDGDDFVREEGLGGVGNFIAFEGQTVVNTGAGRDRFEAGADWLAALSIDGGEGNDILNAGQGNDVIRGGSGRDIIKSVEGDDTIFGGSEADAIGGGAGNDHIEGGNGNNILTGGGGDDVVIGGDDSDLIFGDTNIIVDFSLDDYLKFNNVGDTSSPWGFELAYETFQMPSSLPVEHVNGQSVNNIEIDEAGTVLDASNNDLLFGGKGDDAIYGGAGKDILLGEDGNDFLKGEDGDDRLFGGDGNDLLMGDSSPDGEPGHNPNHIGNDYLSGGAGHDELQGGLGNDTLYGDEGSDKLFGGDGLDTLHGGSDDDILDGGKERDHLYGNAGDDGLLGGDGDDVLVGGAGMDQLVGGKGADTYVYNAGDGIDSIRDDDPDFGAEDTLRFGPGIRPDDIRVIQTKTGLVLFLDDNNYVQLLDWFNPSAKIEKVEFANGLIWDEQAILDHVAEIQGSSENDVVNGTERAETVILYEGDDTANTEGGDDILIGGRGNDTLNGGSGNDQYVFSVGDGSDVISDASGEDAILFDAGISPFNLSYSLDGSDLLIDSLAHDNHIRIQNYIASTDNRIEQIRFSDGTAFSMNDLVQLGGGDDDNLTGTSINDFLSGGAGDDVLNAGDGHDTLTGGRGNDILQGGGGSDTYRFNLGDGHDEIVDAAHGGDRIVFGDGIGPDDIQVRRDGLDLVLEHVNGSDSITIRNVFLSVNHGVNGIQFADGTFRSQQALIESLPAILVGDDGNNAISGGYLNETLRGFEGDDILKGGEGNDILDGGSGDDWLDGGDGHDHLLGGDGNDVLIGGPERGGFFGTFDDDILEGGQGDDLLLGQVGNDTYIFNSGDGHDVILNRYPGSGSIASNKGSDRIVFGPSISPGNVSVHADGFDIVLKYGADSVRVEGAFEARDANRLSEVVFNDGNPDTEDTVWHWFDDVRNPIFFFGTNDNDVHNGTNRDEFLRGGNGNDSLNGSGGNDTLDAGAGNDTLIGGTGDDFIIGGSGADIYVYNRGDGNDRVVNGSYDPVNKILGTNGLIDDVLRFGNDIRPDEIEYARSANGADLILKDTVTGQRLRLEGWFAVELDHRIDGTEGDIALKQIEFADGTVISGEVITAQLTAVIGNNEDNEIFGGRLGDVIDGGGGDDFINGADGDDILHGGAGDDVIYGGLGKDEIRGGRGNDRLFGDVEHGGFDGSGDTFVFNLGDGQDEITGNVNDTLRFENIRAEDILIQTTSSEQSESTFRTEFGTFYRLPYEDLILTHKDTGDSVTLKREDVSIAPIASVGRIEFADRHWVINPVTGEIREYMKPQTGTNDADTLTADASGPALDGRGGEDHLIGDANDNLMAGGTGNDLLEGGMGNDTYVFRRGDGHDVIRDSGGIDQLYLGSEPIVRKEPIVSYNQIRPVFRFVQRRGL